MLAPRAEAVPPVKADPEPDRAGAAEPRRQRARRDAGRRTAHDLRPRTTVDRTQPPGGGGLPVPPGPHVVLTVQRHRPRHEPTRCGRTSSSRSSRRRSSARAPASAWRPSTASSSRAAATSGSTASPGRARRSTSACRRSRPSRRSEADLAGDGRQRRRSRIGDDAPRRGQRRRCARSAREALTRYGYQVIEASNGDEALRSATPRARPHLARLDRCGHADHGRRELADRLSASAGSQGHLHVRLHRRRRPSRRSRRARARRSSRSRSRRRARPSRPGGARRSVRASFEETRDGRQHDCH